WSQSYALSDVVDEVVTTMARNGRVMAADQVAAQLAATRGSTASGRERLRRALAVVRAVILTEPGNEEPLLVPRIRSAGAQLLALTEVADPDGAGGVFPVADVLLEAAAGLGVAADQLVSTGHVVPAATAAGQLRDAVGYPTAITDDALVRLAALTSTSAAVSGLGELYPRALPIETAITFAVRGRPGRSITDAALRNRLTARFPDLATSLPHRPQLDTVVREVLGLEWDGTVYGPPGGSSRTGTSLRPTTVADALPSAIDRTLQQSLGACSALTLAVVPHHHARAVEVLTDLYGVTAVNVDFWAIEHAREVADQRRVRWPVALAADADRTSPGWANLTRLMTEAVRPAWAELLASSAPLLLHHAGVLVRYGMIGLLSELLDTATPHPAARWLLVPRYAHVAVPRLGGQPVPLGPSRFLDLQDPTELVAHRSSTSAGATP